MNNCKNCAEPIPLDHAQVGGVHMKCEQEYYKDKTERRVLIRPLGHTGNWIVQTVEEVKEILYMACLDEEFEIKFKKFTKGDLERLPESDGW